VNSPNVFLYGPTSSSTSNRPWAVSNREDITAGPVTVRGHLYVDDTKLGFKTGLRECAAFETVMNPHPADELILLLEGQVTLVEPNGREATFIAGDAFVIPQGRVCKWSQSASVRSYFAQHGGRSGSHNSGQRVAEITKIIPNGELSPGAAPRPDELVGEVPSWMVNSFFTDPTGAFTVGVWEATRFHFRRRPWGRYEWMLLLNGTVRVTDGADQRRDFKGGDTFLITPDGTIEWENLDTVRKIYCVVKP
jgi:uncharacterized cupin superfamily protein